VSADLDLHCLPRQQTVLDNNGTCTRQSDATDAYRQDKSKLRLKRCTVCEYTYLVTYYCLKIMELTILTIPLWSTSNLLNTCKHSDSIPIPIRFHFNCNPILSILTMRFKRSLHSALFLLLLILIGQ
jgi:hypothetical protein